jgi:hemin uptake protein HemP
MEKQRADVPGPYSGNEDAGAPQPQRVNSTALFGRSRELIIVHNGREYRLRLTQNEKLILTA